MCLGQAVPGLMRRFPLSRKSWQPPPSNKKDDEKRTDMVASSAAASLPLRLVVLDSRQHDAFKTRDRD